MKKIYSLQLEQSLCQIVKKRSLLSGIRRLLVLLAHFMNLYIYIYYEVSDWKPPIFQLDSNGLVTCVRVRNNSTRTLKMFLTREV